MTTFQPGDRIRIVLDGDDGLPLVRYGFVGSQVSPEGPVVVMLDGELGGDVVAIDCVEPVTVATVELCLQGDDLIQNPALRQGLIAMWCAEAETAGLAVDALHPMGNGVPEAGGRWALANLLSGGVPYVVRAEPCRTEPGLVRVHAVRPDPPVG
ncbi:MAG: hypothetical protein WAS51_10060 [Ilumatobacteraceae bacterium]|nr:MAG: hypothetical protein IPM43_02200 [Actinomycetota bacterium]